MGFYKNMFYILGAYSSSYLVINLLKDDFESPASSHATGKVKRSNSGSVENACENNDPIVGAAICFQDGSRDGKANEHTEACDEESRASPLAYVFNIADSADANRRDTNRGTRPETVQHGKRVYGGLVGAGCIPKREYQGRTCGGADGKYIKGTEAIGSVTWQSSAGNCTDVDESVEEVCSLSGHTGVDGIRRDVRVGDEDGEFDEEDSEGGESIFGIAKGFEVDGTADPSAGVLVVRESLLHQADGDAAHDQAYECDDTGGPSKADLWGEVEDDEREHDASKTAGSASNSCGQSTALVKVVADDGDGGIEEQGG